MPLPRVAVIGAGAFGGWTALELRRRGARVTVVDAWGPGNVRASSGGETRVIRLAYGTRAHYTALAIQAMQRWREFEAQIQRRIFYKPGVLWLFDASTDAQSFARASADAIRAQGAVMRELSAAEARRRYPQIDFADVSHVMLEPDAGYLLARRACEDVIDRLQHEQGDYRVGAVAAAVDIDGVRARRLVLNDASVINADIFVFACGPWLGPLFPDVIGGRVTATRQEVFYFGTPAGDTLFTEQELPVWIDLTATSRTQNPPSGRFYGIPGNAYRGFKLADDVAGPEMDPTTGDRNVTPQGMAAARAFLGRRFPGLVSAPVVGSEVCQYEASPDSELIVDRHPQADNVWLIGGGSGHGFKMGPVIGELVASLVLDDLPVDPRFALARFSATSAAAWKEKWA